MPTNLITDLRWKPIRDQIKLELESAEGVLLVHPFRRFDKEENRNEERFRKKFIPQDGKGLINAWAIHRDSEAREFLTNREYEVTILVKLNFWYKQNDSVDSQDTFDEIIDNVITVFQEPLRLECEAEIVQPIQLVESDHRFLAGRLCHQAEFDLVVQHRVFQPSFR